MPTLALKAPPTRFKHGALIFPREAVDRLITSFYHLPKFPRGLTPHIGFWRTLIPKQALFIEAIAYRGDGTDVHYFCRIDFSSTLWVIARSIEGTGVDHLTALAHLPIGLWMKYRKDGSAAPAMPRKGGVL